MLRGLRRARRVARRVAEHYDDDAFIAREVGARLLSRVACARVQPQVVLDLGAGTGSDLPSLRKVFPSSQLLAVDASEVMLGGCPRFWRRRPSLVAADAHALPLPDTSVDLIYSNLLLPWCVRPDLVLSEMGRVLRPGGLLFFSALSPGSTAQFDLPCCVGVLPDVQWWGATLLQGGFADPVVDIDRIRVEYSSPISLVRDFQVFGLSFLLRGVRLDGLVELPLEVLFGHACRASPSTPGDDGGVPIRFVPRGN